MNTNSNTYTIVYTAIIVIVVAAILAFAASSLKSKQEANIKADTISQILTAAQVGTKAEFTAMGNEAVLQTYADNIVDAFIINAAGERVRDLDKENAELATGLKAQNKAIKSGAEVELPVYQLKTATVIPVYGSGLWGPIWGYLAFDSSLQTMVGSYFDHESETPGLGAKIKDDPAFQAQFAGKKVDFAADPVFSIVKGGVKDGRVNAVDAITGATMTSNGLSAAINTWLKAYEPYLSTAGCPEDAEETTNAQEE